jgi:hypothetical protein
MKLAPLVFLATVGLFLGTLATGRRVESPEHVEPLDFTGIDTLELVSDDQVRIDYVRDKPTIAKWTAMGPVTWRAVRHGATLAVHFDNPTYGTLELKVPATVHTLVLEQGEVFSHDIPAAVTVRGAGDVTWHGDAGELRLVDEFPYSHCPARRKPDDEQDYRCRRRNLAIAEGHIDRVQATSWAGVVSLRDVDDLGEVTLALGPEARFALTNLRRLPTIGIVPLAPADRPDEQPWRER